MADLLQTYKETGVLAVKSSAKPMIKYNSIKARLQKLKKRGEVLHVRKGIYLPSTIYYDRYQIACNAVDNGYLCYHGAIEYYALATQMFNWLYVNSSKPFRSFDYQFQRHVYAPLKFLHKPLITKTESGYPVRVTSLSQTIIDCFFNLGYAGGLEELMFALDDIALKPKHLKECMPNEDDMLVCLEKYNNKSLYQRTGYVLSTMKQYGCILVSDWFLDECMKRKGDVVSYLTYPRPTDVFHKEWNIYSEPNIMCEISKGLDPDLDKIY